MFIQSESDKIASIGRQSDAKSAAFGIALKRNEINHGTNKCKYN
jgi:hypothetical protein